MKLIEIRDLAHAKQAPAATPTAADAARLQNLVRASAPAPMSTTKKLAIGIGGGLALAIAVAGVLAVRS